MVTIQVLWVPVHPSLHPLNIELSAGVAVRVTTSFFQYGSLQSPGQLTPVGSLVIVPVPVPVLVTVNAYFGSAANFAVTFLAAVIHTVQVLPFTVVHPVQLVKRECNTGAAVRVTVSPRL
jgi:hypothetical protein